MKTLIPLSDFVLEQEEILTKIYDNSEQSNDDHWARAEFVVRVTNYAKLLKQPLTLGMFVPCDEDGNILKEPKLKPWVEDNGALSEEYDVVEMEDYKEAKEKILFEGWNHEDRYGWVQHHKCGLEINTETGTLAIFDENGIGYGYVKNVEDLVSYGLTLTHYALQQIGIE